MPNDPTDDFRLMVSLSLATGKCRDEVANIEPIGLGIIRVQLVTGETFTVTVIPGIRPK
jgi:hypothetical protein